LPHLCVEYVRNNHERQRFCGTCARLPH
jgi:hypothetical protein